MATYHVDLVNGNDASAGTSWGTAWKTWANGPTAARIAPGDTIKFAKTPNDVSIGNCTWTNNSTTVSIPTGLYKEVQQASSAWTASANVTTSTSATRKLGTTSSNFAVASGFTTGKIAYITISGGGTQDFSDFTKLSFYLYTSTTQVASRLRIRLCSDATGDTVVDEFIIPATTTLTFTPLTLTRSGGGNLGSNIQSISIAADSDPGIVTMRLNNIIATNDLQLDAFIGKADEVYYPILNIIGTNVTLDTGNNTANQGTVYLGSTSVATTFIKKSIYLEVSSINLSEASNSGSRFIYSGGWNTASDTQDGLTIMNSVSITGNLWAVFDSFGVHGASSIGASSNMIIKNCIFGNSSSTLITSSNITLTIDNCKILNPTIFSLTSCYVNVTNSFIRYTSSLFSSSPKYVNFYNCNVLAAIGSLGTLSSGDYVFNECSFVGDFPASSPGNFTTNSRDVTTVQFINCTSATSNIIWITGCSMTWQTTIKQGSDPGAWALYAQTGQIQGFDNPLYFKIADIAVVSGSTVTITAWMKKTDASNSVSKIALATLPNKLGGVTAQRDEHGANTNWEQLSITINPTVTGVVPIYAEFSVSTTFVYAHVGSITITTT